MNGDPRPPMPLREYVDPNELWPAIEDSINVDMDPAALSPVFKEALKRLARGVALGGAPGELPGLAGRLANSASTFTVGVLMGAAIGRRSDILVFKHERPAAQPAGDHG